MFGAEEDEEETERKFLYRDKQKIDFGDLNTARGKTSVFTIEDIVKVLRYERMEDIAVIKLPESIKYCDFMVIATGMSTRHLTAVCEFIRKLYKKKKLEEDPFLVVEGQTSKDWKVLDMDAIVVHLMLSETRGKYEIEMLWTCGEQYDDLTQKPNYESAINLMEKHTKFLDELSTARN